MSELPSQITAELIREVKRRVHDECLLRVVYCLEQLNEDQIWWRPNDQSNSIGNLVLHLCGNLRQWVLSGIGGQEDIRARQQEFDERGPLPKEELIARIETVVKELVPVIENVTASDLIERRPVQVYEESVLGILVHITEHFSYHTGQIAWITKMLTSEDLGFYRDVDLG